MGEIVGAGLIAHVPTMVLPLEVRLELNEGNDISLIDGIREIRREKLDELQADTVIVFDSHWFTTVEFCVTGHSRRSGLMTSDELPRGMCQIPYDIKGDPELASLIEEEVNSAGSWMSSIDDPYLPIHYPTVNLLTFLQGDEKWITVSTPQTGETDDFLLAGKAIGRAIERYEGRVVLLASGAMSHRFWPLKQLRSHEASDPKHIRSPEAYAADMERLAWMKAGEHHKVLETMDEFLPFAPEGRFGHYLQMISALGGSACTAKGVQFGDYENSIGTGQVHVWFDRPDKGWS